MRKLTVNIEQSSKTEVLNRMQLKNIMGGVQDDPILCYCDQTEPGPYKTQWIAPGCNDQQIAAHCGTGTGTCGAC